MRPLNALMSLVSTCSRPRAWSSFARVDWSFPWISPSDWPRDRAGASEISTSAASANVATNRAVGLHRGVRLCWDIGLFPALTGLAVGLALKESRYAGHALRFAPRGTRRPRLPMLWVGSPAPLRRPIRGAPKRIQRLEGRVLPPDADCRSSFACKSGGTLSPGT